MAKITKKDWSSINKRKAFIDYMDGRPLQVLNLKWQALGWKDVTKEPYWENGHLIYRIDPKKM